MLSYWFGYMKNSKITLAIESIKTQKNIKVANNTDSEAAEMLKVSEWFPLLNEIFQI